ncbi:MAG: HAMP domain-containing histidine kinase [Dehalococcoidia bacterium]|nr:HAMP domain-containing histidine kinase [Dehalococcoidia bacterium]
MEAASKPARNARAKPSPKEPRVSFFLDEPAQDILFIVHDERTEARPDEADRRSHAVRLDSMMREISARIAQELNGPLDTVVLYAQLLLAGCSPDDTARQGLERIYGEAKRAGQVVADLRSFSRGNRPDKALVSVEDILRRSLDAVFPGAGTDGLEIVLEVEPDLPWIMADPDLLQRAFAYIMDNARQAVTGGAGPRQIRIRAARAGGMVRVTVEDTGPGMSQEILSRLFKPFFTTREAGNGMGLGLTLSHTIIEQHDGYIYAMSNPDCGASVVVELPC